MHFNNTLSLPQTQTEKAQSVPHIGVGAALAGQAMALKLAILKRH